MQIDNDIEASKTMLVDVELTNSERGKDACKRPYLE